MGPTSNKIVEQQGVPKMGDCLPPAQWIIGLIQPSDESCWKFTFKFSSGVNTAGVACDGIRTGWHEFVTACLD